jgi:hypothetical protein
MPVATRTEENQTPEMSARSKRSIGEDVAPAPGHSVSNVPRDYKTVLGWGADLDPANRPSYPKELPSNVMTARGEVRDWQVPPHKIHVSNEHPNLTPVFGTACPPSGLSGRLRDYAFEFGEATNRHWMTLLLADRVNMVESMIGDALRGKPDHYIREKGWSANLKYRDERDRQRAMVTAGVSIGLVLLAFALPQIRKANGRG